MRQLIRVHRSGVAHIADINIALKIQWNHTEYGGKEGGAKVKRPVLVAAQVVELVEWDGDSPATANEDPDLEF